MAVDKKADENDSSESDMDSNDTNVRFSISLYVNIQYLLLHLRMMHRF